MLNRKHAACARIDLKTLQEMSAYDLEQLLANELSKPARDIDSSLVEQLLKMLQPEVRPVDTRDADWAAIRQRISKQHHKQPARIILARTASIAAIFVVCISISMSAAKAFNWTFLYQWLEPIAQTFNIHLGDSQSTSLIDTSHNSESQTAGETQITYTALADMPTVYNGYSVIPAYIPAGYQFRQGSFYDDMSITNIVLLYTDEHKWLSVKVQIYKSDNDAGRFEFEQTLETPETMAVGENDITIYRNSDNAISASWIDRNATYHVQGNITDDDLRVIIEKYGG